MVKNPKYGPVTSTLKSNRVREVVKEHVHAKFHQALCSSLWVIMLTDT